MILKKSGLLSTSSRSSMRTAASARWKSRACSRSIPTRSGLLGIEPAAVKEKSLLPSRPRICSGAHRAKQIGSQESPCCTVSTPFTGKAAKAGMRAKAARARAKAKERTAVREKEKVKAKEMVRARSLMVWAKALRWSRDATAIFAALRAHSGRLQGKAQGKLCRRDVRGRIVCHDRRRNCWD